MLTALDLAGIPLLAGGPGRRRPDRARGRPRGLQPRADRRLPRRGRAGRRRADRDRDHRGHPRVEGRGPARRARRAADAAGRVRRGLRARSSTTSTTTPTAASSASRPTGPACRGGCTSTPSWTSTSGRTRRSRWSRWPRPCTSGSAWRSSAAARAAAGSARPGMITRPVRERSITTIGAMVENGLKESGFNEVGLLSLSSAPTTPRSARSPRAWPTATRAPTPRCRCPPPGSTPSTSTWPTSSPATAGAPA